MSDVTFFDTLEYMNKLNSSGMNPLHAEAITKATASALNEAVERKDFCTKSDLKSVEFELKSYIGKSIIKYISIAITIISGIQLLLHFMEK